MPRQLLFYMSREDENEFIDYIRSTGNTVILPAVSEMAGFTPLATLPDASQDEATRKFWLQNTSVSLPLITEYLDQTGNYIIDGFQSPVVEFLRSIMVSQILLPGRIQADLTYFDDDKADLVSKPAEFKKWFESMENWIRKKYKHLTLLTYVGPGAEKYRNEGGLLH